MSSLGCGCFKNFLLLPIRSVSFSLHHGRRGMGPFTKCMQDSRIGRAARSTSSSSDSFIRLLPRKRERGGPQLKLEMGKVHHPSPPTTTTTTPTSQEHGRPQKKRCNFSHEIAFIFMEERSRKRSPSSVDCAVVGRGAGPLRDMSYGFKEFKVAAEESQKGDPKVLAYRGTPKHPLE